eukprot:TRINITY_DN1572_c0_g1_i7.p1 TRINITY_DN1572_c0_g1~~TRINITY_DN1572_c0_g1_i7.p1  ORF type:complete len:852 (-),score=193.03 TRINITY_DN1572_c0_g1_i7:157-2712(-)
MDEGNSAILGTEQSKSAIKGILTSGKKSQKRRISWGAIKIREFIKNDHSWESFSPKTGQAKKVVPLAETDQNKEIVRQIDSFEKSSSETNGISREESSSKQRHAQSNGVQSDSKAPSDNGKAPRRRLSAQVKSIIKSKESKTRLSDVARDVLRAPAPSPPDAVIPERPSLRPSLGSHFGMESNRSQSLLVGDLSRLEGISDFEELSRRFGSELPGLSSSPITANVFNFSCIAQDEQSLNISNTQFSLLRALSPGIGKFGRDDDNQSAPDLLENSILNESSLTNSKVRTLAALAADYNTSLSKENSQNLPEEISQMVDVNLMEKDPVARQEAFFAKTSQMDVSENVEQRQSPSWSKKESPKFNESSKRKAHEFMQENMQPDETKKMKRNSHEISLCSPIPAARTKSFEAGYKSPVQTLNDYFRMDTVERKNHQNQSVNNLPKQQKQPFIEPREKEVTPKVDTSLTRSPIFPKAEEFTVGKVLKGSQQEEGSFIGELINKSPSINKLQKQFLISFLSPKAEREPTRLSLSNLGRPNPDPLELPNMKLERVNPNLRPWMKPLSTKCNLAYKNSLEFRAVKQIASDLEKRLRTVTEANRELKEKKRQLELALASKQKPVTIDARQTIMLAFAENVLGFKVLKVVPMKSLVSHIFTVERSFTLEITTKTLGEQYFVEGIQLIPIPLCKPRSLVANIDLPTKNPFNDLMLLSAIVMSQMRTLYLKKTVRRVDNIVLFASHKLLALAKLREMIDFLLLRHNIDSISVDAVNGIARIVLRLKNILAKKLSFSLNLFKHWFQDFEMEIIDDELTERFNPRQLDAINRKLVMVFNKEVACLSVEKLGKIFHHLDNFKIMVL